MALGYCTVRVNIGALIIDGIDEDDVYEDVPVTGNMILTPMLDPAKPVQVDDNGVMKIKAISAFPVDIGLTGSISHRNRDYVAVPAPTGLTSNLSMLQWRATFNGLKYGLTAVSVPPIYFWAEPGLEINLADHINVGPNSTALQLSRGPRGFGIGGVAADGGDLVFTSEAEGSPVLGRVALPAGGGGVADGGVTSVKLAADAVTRSKLAVALRDELDGKAAVSALASKADVSALASKADVSALAAKADVSALSGKLDKTEAASTYAPVDDPRFSEIGGASGNVTFNETSPGSGLYEVSVAPVETVTPYGSLSPVDTSRNIACWGESTTESVGTNWPELILGPMIGVNVYNRGKSGQGVADIILRQGGLRPQLTLAGNQIPATVAPVVVTAIDPAVGWRINSTGSFGFSVELAGVVGQLAHNLVADTWTFTRDVGGDVVTVPPRTPCVRTDASLSGLTNIIWTGRNNVTTLQLPVVRDLLPFVREGISTQVKRVLVVGVINAQAEGTGTNRYSLIKAHNAALASKYGAEFLDVRREFIDNGMTRAGLTPTGADTAAIAADKPPASLMFDDLHPNTAGYTVVARIVAEKLLELGWITAIGAAAPTVAPTVTAGAPAETAQPLTVGAVSGATSFVTRYKASSSGTWITGPSGAGPNFTVSGLNAATAYDYQAAAVNSSGQGPWSATVSATTATAVVVTTITSDTFNRADGTFVATSSDAGLGGSSLPYTSDSQIQVLGNAVGATTISTARFAMADTGLTDHSSSILIGAGLGGGVIARGAGTGGQNCYSLRGNGTGGVLLEKRVAGVTTAIATITNAGVVVGDRITLKVSGTEISAYRNGVLIDGTAVTDTSLTDGTFAGFRSGSTTSFKLDDWKVTTP